MADAGNPPIPGAGDPITVLIADDHFVVREGTRRIFDESSEFLVVGEAERGDDAVNIAWRERPDVAVLDIRMPGLNGIEAAQRILERSPRTAVIALTAFDDEVYAMRMIDAGARGYLLKTARADAILDAVRQVIAGEMAIAPEMQNRIAIAALRSGGTAEPPLTTREMEVLEGISRGLRNKEIARDLGLSVRTIEGHVEVILTRLDVDNRTEAALIAVSRGWFADDSSDTDVADGG